MKPAPWKASTQVTVPTLIWQVGVASGSTYYDCTDLDTILLLLDAYACLCCIGSAYKTWACVVLCCSWHLAAYTIPCQAFTKIYDLLYMWYTDVPTQHNIGMLTPVMQVQVLIQTHQTSIKQGCLCTHQPLQPLPHMRVHTMYPKVRDLYIFFMVYGLAILCWHTHMTVHRMLYIVILHCLHSIWVWTASMNKDHWFLTRLVLLLVPVTGTSNLASSPHLHLGFSWPALAPVSNSDDNRGALFWK